MVPGTGVATVKFSSSFSYTIAGLVLSISRASNLLIVSDKSKHQNCFWLPSLARHFKSPPHLPSSRNPNVSFSSIREVESFTDLRFILQTGFVRGDGDTSISFVLIAGDRYRYKKGRRKTTICGTHTGLFWEFRAWTLNLSWNVARLVAVPVVRARSASLVFVFEWLYGEWVSYERDRVVQYFWQRSALEHHVP